MRGTRYGDFSRLSPGWSNGYRSVLMQQGRVQLDADWNDQVALGEHMLREAVADVLGGSGAPARAPGYAIHAERALEFDGSEALDIQDPEGITPRAGEEQTVELWIAWTGHRGVLVDCTTEDGDAGYQLAIEPDGRLSCAVSCWPGSPVIAASETRLERHARAHLAIVFGGDYVALYLDSRQLVRSPLPPDSPPPAELLRIGAPVDGSGGGFHGLLFGLRISSSARSPVELAAAARPRPSEQPEPDVLAAWMLQDGTELEDRVNGLLAVPVGDGPPAWRLADISIGPGRYYVDGILCEQREWRRYDEQPGCASRRLPREGRHLVYLEVWEETVSATQDASLREVALGGVDTAVRTRIASCVRHERLLDEREGTAEALRRTLTRAAQNTTGRLAADHSGELTPGNYLYRVEIHASGRSPHRRDEREKHAPTFKWSRRNGADTFAIAAVEHRSDTVHLLGLPQGIEPLAPGDLVEVLDDAMPVDGDADALLEVREVRAGGAVLLSGPVPARVAHDASRHPFLRRWDHAPPDDAAGADADDGAIPVHDHWTRLEHGIRVRFEPDRHYTRGDYWWIVARQDLPGGIEWPKRRGEPRHMPPDGVERRVAPLALLDLDGDAIDVIDLRTSVPAAPSRPVVPWPEPALEPPEADDGDGDGERDGESDGDGPEPVPEPAIPYEPEPPPGQPPPTQRFEFAIIGPAGPPPPGFVATGLEVVTRPHWRRVGAVELVAEELQAVASWEGRLLLATAEAIWAFDGAVTRRLTGLAERRHGFAMRIVEGLLMLVGGRGESGGPDGRMFALDMVRLEWSERARMRERVEGAAVAAAEGRVHVIGGHRRRRPTRDHQVFESATGEWTKGPRPSTERSHAVAVVADGHVRVVGGLDRDGRPLSLHEAFGPTGGWHGEGALPRPYHVHAAAVYRDRHAVLVQDPRRPELQHVLTYHSALARWDSLAQLPGGVRPLDLISNAEGFVAVAADSSGGVVIYEMTFLVDWTVFAPDPA